MKAKKCVHFISYFYLNTTKKKREANYIKLILDVLKFIIKNHINNSIYKF